MRKPRMRLVLGGLAIDMLMLRERQLAIDPSARGRVALMCLNSKIVGIPPDPRAGDRLGGFSSF
jgi:hypothetical protein